MHATDKISESDRIEDLPQPRKVAQKKVEAIFIFLDSEIGPGQGQSASRPKTASANVAVTPSIFRVFSFPFDYKRGRAYLPRAAKTSALNPNRRAVLVSPSESSKGSESSGKEKEKTDSPQENVPSAIVPPTEVPRSPISLLDFVEARPVPRSSSDGEIVLVLGSPNSSTMAQPERGSPKSTARRALKRNRSCRKFIHCRRGF